MPSRRNTFPMFIFVTLACICGYSGSAYATNWAEVGDADDLTAQVTVGTGPLSTISGDHAGFDPVDLYCISITDPSAFYATTPCLTDGNYDLVLFDANGNGVALTDNCSIAGVVQISPALVPAAGIYWLGHISPDSSPLSSTGAMWINQLFTPERAPDGPGAGNPLLSWSLGNAPSDPYTISLSGAGFCETPVAVQASNWGRLKTLWR